MNASDIINAVGLSPGIIATVTGVGTTTYTATQNLEVRFQCFNGGNNLGVFTVNGIQIGGQNVASGPSTTIINVAKGQTMTIVCASGCTTTALVTARGIN